MLGFMAAAIDHITDGRPGCKHVFDLTSLLADLHETLSLSTAILLVTTGPLLLSWRFASNHPPVVILALCWLLLLPAGRARGWRHAAVHGGD
jgi:hypothetical protein